MQSQISDSDLWYQVEQTYKKYDDYNEGYLREEYYADYFNDVASKLGMPQQFSVIQAKQLVTQADAQFNQGYADKNLLYEAFKIVTTKGSNMQGGNMQGGHMQGQGGQGGYMQGGNMQGGHMQQGGQGGHMQGGNMQGGNMQQGWQGGNMQGGNMQQGGQGGNMQGNHMQGGQMQGGMQGNHMQGGQGGHMQGGQMQGNCMQGGNMQGGNMQGGQGNNMQGYKNKSSDPQAYISGNDTMQGTKAQQNGGNPYQQ